MGCGTKEGVAGRFARLGCANNFYNATGPAEMTHPAAKCNWTCKKKRTQLEVYKSPRWALTGSSLGRHWVVTGSSLGRHWVVTGSSLGRHWVATGSPLSRQCAHFMCLEGVDGLPILRRIHANLEHAALDATSGVRPQPALAPGPPVFGN